MSKAPREERRDSEIKDRRTSGEQLLEIHKIVKRVLFEIATAHDDSLPLRYNHIIQAHGTKLMQDETLVGELVAKCVTAVQPNSADVNEVLYATGDAIELAPPPADELCDTYENFELRLAAHLDAGNGENIRAEAAKYGFETEDATKAMEYLDRYVKQHPNVVLFEGAQRV